MPGKICQSTRKERLAVMVMRYRGVSKQEKMRLLYEMVALAGGRDGHAIRPLRAAERVSDEPGRAG